MGCARDHVGCSSSAMGYPGSMAGQLAIPYGGHRTPCVVEGRISVVGFELNCFEIEKIFAKQQRSNSKGPTQTEHHNSTSRGT